MSLVEVLPPFHLPPDPARQGPQEKNSAGDTPLRSDQLEQRLRRWMSVARLVEHNAQYFETVEADRDLAYRDFAELVPRFGHSARQLNQAMELVKGGGAPAGLSAMIRDYEEQVQALESAVGRISAQAAWYSEACEKYAASVEEKRALEPQVSTAAPRE